MTTILPITSTRQQILDFVQSVIPVTGAFQATEFLSYIQSVEEEFIFPAINETMYGLIVATPVNYPRVYDALKIAVVNAAMGLFTPVLNVAIGANGMNNVETGKVKAAALEDKRAANNHFRKMANDGLERALKLMEADGTALYNPWKLSPQYTVFKDCLIQNVTDYTASSSIRINRRVFLLMKKPMIMAEYKIKLALGTLLFGALKTNVTADYVFLLENFVKPIIAKKAMSESIQNISLTFGEDDTLLMFDNTSTDLIQKGRALGKDMLDYYEDEFEEQACGLQSEMMAFVKDNALLFPEYPVVAAYPILPKDMGKITRM